MKRILCPIAKQELEQLYLTDKLTDDQIAIRLGHGATAKRVRSWRKRYEIRTLARWERHTLPAIEERLKSVLVGSMLGDGRLSFRTHATHYSERHSEKQKSYLEWKANEWGDWVQSELKSNSKTEGGREYITWRFHTVAHPMLNEWRDIFYENRNRGWKILRPEVVDHVDELALAIWYLDDGHVGWWPNLTFGSTQESRKVAWAIFEKFGLRPRWQEKVIRAPHETGEFRMEREETAEDFLRIIRPHVPECMNYKLSGFGYDSGRNNIIKGKLTPEALQSLASQGIPIRRMAKMLGASSATVDRHLKKHGIEHPRTKGRPR